MRILLTGFGPFGEFTVNPAQQVVQAVALRSQAIGGNDLYVDVLPTEFAAAGERIRTLIREIRPGACVCLGVQGMDNSIRLERVAMNWDEPGMFDAAGQLGGGGPIVPEGPDAYLSTLPLARLQNVLQQLGMPVIISDDAGGYVCNHVFYLACHEIALSGFGTRCGFVHVPPISRTGELSGDIAGLQCPMLVRAIESCLSALQ